MNFKLNILTLLTATVGAAQVNFTNPDEGAVVSFQTTAIEPKEELQVDHQKQKGKTFPMV